MGSKVRHWKERFREGADYVYVRTVNLGGGVIVKAGDPVDLSTLGPKPEARLRLWWDSGIIRLKEFQAPNVLTGRREKPVSESHDQTVTPDETREQVSQFLSRKKGKKQQ